MKWMGRTVNTLIVLALSTILIASLQPIVRSIAPEEALTASVELARWTERPTETGVEDEREEVSEGTPVRDAYRHIFQSNNDFAQAYIFLENNTSKVAENVRIRFADNFERDVQIISDDGLVKTSIIGTSNIFLPDMYPGDKLRIHLWYDVGFNESLFPLSFKSFSSLGPFKMELSVPEKHRYYEDDSAFFDFLDEWIGLFIFVVLIASIALLVWMVSYYEKYVKRMFSDYDFYESERSRFEEDGKKFVPRLHPTT